MQQIGSAIKTNLLHLVGLLFPRIIFTFYTMEIYIYNLQLLKQKINSLFKQDFYMMYSSWYNELLLSNLAK